MSRSAALSSSVVLRYDKIGFSLTIACHVGNFNNARRARSEGYVPEWQTEGPHHEVLSMTSGLGLELGLTFCSFAYSKSLRTLSPVTTPGYRSDKQKLHEIGPDASYWDDIKNAHTSKIENLVGGVSGGSR